MLLLCNTIKLNDNDMLQLGDLWTSLVKYFLYLLCKTMRDSYFLFVILQTSDIAWFWNQYSVLWFVSIMIMSIMILFPLTISLLVLLHYSFFVYLPCWLQ